jgi:hypothetical protein
MLNWGMGYGLTSAVLVVLLSTTSAPTVSAELCKLCQGSEWATCASGSCTGLYSTTRCSSYVAATTDNCRPKEFVCCGQTITKHTCGFCGVYEAHLGSPSSKSCDLASPTGRTPTRLRLDVSRVTASRRAGERPRNQSKR